MYFDVKSETVMATLRLLIVYLLLACKPVEMSNRIFLYFPPPVK